MKWLCFFSVTQKQRLHYTDHIRKLPVSQCANYIFETTKKKDVHSYPLPPSPLPPILSSPLLLLDGRLNVLQVWVSLQMSVHVYAQLGWRQYMGCVSAW